MAIQLTIYLEPLRGEEADDHVPVLRAQLEQLLPPTLAVNAPKAVYRVAVEALDEDA